MNFILDILIGMVLLTLIQKVIKRFKRKIKYTHIVYDKKTGGIKTIQEELSNGLVNELTQNDMIEYETNYHSDINGNEIITYTIKLK